MIDAIGDNRNDDVIGHEFSTVHDVFCAESRRRARGHRFAQHIAGRQLRDAKARGNLLRLSTFSRAWRSQHNQSHQLYSLWQSVSRGCHQRADCGWRGIETDFVDNSQKRQLMLERSILRSTPALRLEWRGQHWKQTSATIAPDSSTNSDQVFSTHRFELTAPHIAHFSSFLRCLNL